MKIPKIELSRLYTDKEGRVWLSPYEYLERDDCVSSIRRFTYSDIQDGYICVEARYADIDGKMRLFNQWNVLFESDGPMETE